MKTLTLERRQEAPELGILAPELCYQPAMPPAVTTVPRAMVSLSSVAPMVRSLFHEQMRLEQERIRRAAAKAQEGQQRAYDID